MKKSGFKLIILMVTIGFLLAGCETAKEAPPENYVAPTNLTGCKTFMEAGKRMIVSVLKGLSTKNYPLYSRDFSEKNKKYFDKKVFTKAAEAVSEELGEFKTDEFVGFWQKGDYDIMLWKASFSKTEDDVLIQMYIRKTDGIYQIAALKLI